MNINENYFRELISELRNLTVSEEFFAISLGGETTQFCRFNAGAIRQAGMVSQCNIELRLVKGGRHARSGTNLTGELREDSVRIKHSLATARRMIDVLPEDPHLLFADEVKSTSVTSGDQQLKSPTFHREIIADISKNISKKDFVGIYAGGEIFKGFANSHGQVNWFATCNFNLDWSVYVRGDKAAKSGIAGKSWNTTNFTDRLQQLEPQIAALHRPDHIIKPGMFRVYFTPSAVAEFLSILSWGGFGLRSQKSKASPLLKLVSGEAQLSPEVTISENTGEGVAPNFDNFGFTKPNEVSLIKEGRHAGSLVSAGTAKEYGATPNGASEWESPASIAMAPGTIATKEILDILDTGIYVNNLWYLNYSDRSQCRITGMTRFATFWVENGKIVAPLGVMRFDDSFYRVFGQRLAGLTRERELMLDPATYEHRSTGSFHVPGALVTDLTLTL